MKSKSIVHLNTQVLVAAAAWYEAVKAEAEVKPLDAAVKIITDRQMELATARVKTHDALFEACKALVERSVIPPAMLNTIRHPTDSGAD